jgi:hypothetical protein
MSQVSPFLRRATDGYSHWCPGCGEMHKLPDSWEFNGNLASPTFTPSFKHSGIRKNIVDGKWVGEGKDAWLYNEQGKPLPYVCHYILTKGILNFCGDCTHAMAGKAVPLPELPLGHQDEEF